MSSAGNRTPIGKPLEMPFHMRSRTPSVHSVHSATSNSSAIRNALQPLSGGPKSLQRARESNCGMDENSTIKASELNQNVGLNLPPRAATTDPKQMMSASMNGVDGGTGKYQGVFGRKGSRDRIKKMATSNASWGDYKYGWEEPLGHYETTYDQLNRKVPAALDSDRQKEYLSGFPTTYGVKVTRLRQEMNSDPRYHPLTGRKNPMPPGPSDAYFPGKDNRRRSPITGWDRSREKKFATSLIDTITQPGAMWEFKGPTSAIFSSEGVGGNGSLAKTLFKPQTDVTRYRHFTRMQGMLDNGRHPNWPGVM